MARVTVEDCVLQVPNRFELVLLAAQRARDLAGGATLSLDRDDDKNPVVALREIADQTLNLDNLQNALVTGLQKLIENDEPEEDRELSIGGASFPLGAGDAAIDEELKEDMLVVGEDGAEEDALDPDAEEDELGDLPPDLAAGLLGDEE